MKEYNEILYPNTGTEQVPQMYDLREGVDEDKRWLRDTTFIIDHLEKDPRLRDREGDKGRSSVVPSCAYQGL